MKSAVLFCALTLATSGVAALAVDAAVAAPVSISAVQGTGEVSPLLNQIVTVEGVISGDFSGGARFDGFTIQDAQGDENPATSDAIFVYLGARSRFAAMQPRRGDKVRVTGRIGESKGQTQISAPTAIEVIGQGTPIEPQQIPLAAATNWEALEGMLVRFPQTLVVTAQNDLARYGTLKLSLARAFNPTNQRSVAEVKAEPQPEVSITLDDGSGDADPNPTPYLDAQNTRRAGATVSDLVGVVSQYGAEYRIEPTEPPQFADANPRPLAPPVVGGSLRVASANVLNYWTTLKSRENPDARGAGSAEQFEKQSAKTMAALRGLDADVLGVMELENNPETVTEFTRRLNAVYGADGATETYAAIIDPPQGLGGDAIRVGLFYKPAKVEPIGPARVKTDAIFERFPLAQTFRDKQTGGVFTVVANHFKSKGSAPKAGDIDLGEGAWNEKRARQAYKLIEFFDELILDSRDPDVLAIGDFNAYAQETPLQNLRAAGLTHLNLRLAPAERYSFAYNGLFGSLDHAFATPHLDAQITGFGEWHINADEPFFNVYNRVKAENYQADPYRFSDHDPFVVGLDLK